MMKFYFYLRYHTNYGERIFLNFCQTPGSQETAESIEMLYLNQDFWKLDIEIDTHKKDHSSLDYCYVLKNAVDESIPEYGFGRRINIGDHHLANLHIYDVWNYAGEFENVFYSAPFKNILLQQTNGHVNKIDKDATHVFRIKAPLLLKDEIPCLLGSGNSLGNWDQNAPVLLDIYHNEWQAALNLTGVQFPLAYKYGVYNKKKKAFVRFEDGDNRTCFEPALPNEQIILNDGFIHLPNNTWKGAGVAVPVFGLRSENGFGVGEFTDLHLLVDWAKKAGMKLIQILPVNDTTATNTWHDSYPYAAISAFALHPIFLNLEKVAGNKHEKIISALKRKKKQLNELEVLDYEEVMRFKIAILRELFEIDGKECIDSYDYKEFFESNKEWLKPYAAFCYLRDKYKTSDFTQWKTNVVYRRIDIDRFFHVSSAGLKDVQFYCYVQYHLHLQLKDAVEYAHRKNIIIKGDIPIGVYRYGCDAWVSPELFNMDMQAGAPPDDFAAKGQNWGFPTYNWQRMQADEFAWWRQRFEQMSKYFDAFRIDHILGFFRIWSIPIHSVQGIMGKFDPCLPVHISEFAQNGIWFNLDRFCTPYITDSVLSQIFGQQSDEVKEQFLQKIEADRYLLKPDFDTQRKVQNWFQQLEQSELNEKLCNGLYDLISNIILFEEENSGGQNYHFRIAIDKTLSYQHLDGYTKEKLWNLYINYFFKRQTDFWRKESLKKLPGLKAATNMLVCGEDLGMVPDCVPDVMRQLGILSLEIQRMPKQIEKEFFHPADAPYLSVVTPSTHDMSTIRGWWQENPEMTQRFYNVYLGQSGGAPFYCEPWINRAIVMQHLYSPAMWSIFQIQDILGMSEKLRRQMPEDERINIPADPNHYWRYRMHLTLEQLLHEKDFAEELKGYVQNSGR